MMQTCLPTSLHLADGNGGEYRKSYHGYPAPFAHLIESPQALSFTPMQIDTRNREHGVTAADVHKCTNFSGVGENGKKCAGYEPRQARYGRGWGGVPPGVTVPAYVHGLRRLPHDCEGPDEGRHNESRCHRVHAGDGAPGPHGGHRVSR